MKMRLTDPAFIDYQHAWAEDADDGPPPFPPANEHQPISLPTSFLPSNLFVKVVSARNTGCEFGALLTRFTS